MKQKRDNVYIWCTWLTKYITGESQCEFATWLKAHYKLDKRPSTFNSRKWNIDHTQLLHKHRDELEAQGYVVKLEDQNSFKMCYPKGITVSGKADIVGLVLNPNGTIVSGLVDDCKTGRPKDSDQVQVMLYMLFLPAYVKAYEGVRFDGNVIYNDSKVPIGWAEVDSSFKELVDALIKRIGADKPCRKVPSLGECRYCDLTKQDCPERME